MPVVTGESATITQDVAPPSRLDMNQGKAGGFFHGLLLQAGARWGAQVLSWASTIVVARRLSLEDYGIVAMSMVYLGVTATIAEFGLGATIIAKRDLTQHQLDQLHAVSVAIGLGCFLVSILVAPVLAAFYGEPRVLWAVLVMSFAFLFSGFSTVPMARARQMLDYRVVSRTELLGAITTTVVVLGLALANARFWALVIGNAAGALAIAVAIGRRRFVTMRRPHLAQIRDALENSRYVLRGQIAYYGYLYADSLAVGRVLGAAPLGIYRFAGFIASLPGEKLVNVVSSVSLAYFGKLSDDRAALREFFLLLTEAISVLAFPVLIGLALVASDVVPLLFGAKWSGSVIPLRIMAFGAAVQIVSVLLSQVLTATLQAKRASKYAIWILVFLPPMYWMGAKSASGIIAVAAVWALAQPVSAAAPLRLVLRTLDLRLANYLNALVPAVTGCVLMAAAVLSVYAAIPGNSASFSRLALAVSTGAITYAAVQATLFRARTLHILTILRSR